MTPYLKITEWCHQETLNRPDQQHLIWDYWLGRWALNGLHKPDLPEHRTAANRFTQLVHGKTFDQWIQDLGPNPEPRQIESQYFLNYTPELK